MFAPTPIIRFASRIAFHATLTLLWLSLCLAQVSASAADDSGRPILLENRTYNSMWFRVRSAVSGYSDWTKLLPGERLQYNGLSSMTVDVAESGGKQCQFTLNAGETYMYTRNSRASAPELSSDPVDGARGLWKRPTQPPSANEFGGFAPASLKAGSGAFQPLEQFMDGCEAAGDSYKLSLKDLAIECFLAQQRGPLPDDLRYVKGFTWFFGYLVDRAKGDVVLLGVKDPTRPPINIDCLATAVMAAHFNLTPACSLDKDPDPQFQASVVRGVPWNTRWAEIMIDADYTMKQVCQGQTDPHVAGLQSVFDQDWYDVLPTNGHSEKEDRWWFNFDNKVRRAIGSSRGDLTVLFRNPVIVSTEKNINGHYGTGATDDNASAFARGFTDNMEELGEQYPSIRELTALFRLHDLFFHLKHVGGTEAPLPKYWLEQYKRPYAGPAHQVPTLTRSGSRGWSDSSYNYTRTLRITGGVLMRMSIGKQTLDRAGDDESVAARILDR